LGLDLGLFKPFTGAQHAFEAQDQENGNTGQNQKLDQG
jgi:hypothetical protein